MRRLPSIHFKNVTNLLKTVGIADDEGITVTTDRINSYVFLLKMRGISFSYPFVFKPLPVSSDLQDELYELHNADFLNIGSPIHLAPRGENWLKKNPIPENKEGAIRSSLKEFAKMDEMQLFDEIYAIACK